MVIHEESVIKNSDKTDAAKVGGVGQMLTLDDKGGRGGSGNADDGWQRGEGGFKPPHFWLT